MNAEDVIDVPAQLLQISDSNSGKSLVQKIANANPRYNKHYQERSINDTQIKVLCRSTRKPNSKYDSRKFKSRSDWEQYLQTALIRQPLIFIILLCFTLLFKVYTKFGTDPL